MTNEAAERLLNVIEASVALDETVRAALLATIPEALAEERALERAATVERIRARPWSDGSEEPFKDPNSDMAVGYRNGLRAGWVRLMMFLDEELRTADAKAAASGEKP